MLYGGLKESRSRRKISTEPFSCRGKRPREDAQLQIPLPIRISGWKAETWRRYIYYLNSGGYTTLSTDKPSEVLDLFRLADFVGDEALMKLLIIWFKRSCDSHNIAERIFSTEYQKTCFTPLQKVFRKIFLKLWMTNVLVREKTLGFLKDLEKYESDDDDWTVDQAKDLFGELLAQLPLRGT